MTFARMRPPLATIMLMLSLGFVTRYGGTDATLGLAFTKTGWLYPFFAALLGWLGVALTGSDTSSNVLFGSLQKITAQQLGFNPILIVTANSTGGVMGKMIDAQSIVVATASTGQVGQEGRILRFVFWHSVALAAIMGVDRHAAGVRLPVDDPVGDSPTGQSVDLTPKIPATANSQAAGGEIEHDFHSDGSSGLDWELAVWQFGFLGVGLLGVGLLGVDSAAGHSLRPLKTEPRSQVHPRAAAEAVGDVEVDLHERGDDEQSGAGAAVPFGVLQARAEVDGLRGIHEDGQAELCAAQHRRDRHAKLARGHHSRSPSNVPVRKPRRVDDPPSSSRSYGGSVASELKYCTRPATTDCPTTRRYRGRPPRSD